MPYFYSLKTLLTHKTPALVDLNSTAIDSFHQTFAAANADALQNNISNWVVFILTLTGKQVSTAIATYNTFGKWEG